MALPRSPREQAAYMAGSAKNLYSGLLRVGAITAEQLQAWNAEADVLARTGHPDALGRVRVRVAQLLTTAPRFREQILATVGILTPEGESPSQRFHGAAPQQRDSGRHPTAPATWPDPQAQLPQPPRPRGPGHTAVAPDSMTGSAQYPGGGFVQPAGFPGYGHGMPPASPPPLPAGAGWNAPYAGVPGTAGGHGGPPPPIPQQPTGKGAGDTTLPFANVMRPGDQRAGQTDDIWAGREPPQQVSPGGVPLGESPSPVSDDAPVGLDSAPLPELSMGDSSGDPPPRGLDSDLPELSVGGEGSDLPDLSLHPAGETIYKDSGAVAADLERLQEDGNAVRPPFYDVIRDVAEQALNGDARKSQVYTMMEEAGLFSLNAAKTSPFRLFLGYIDTKPGHSYEDELMLELLVRGINETSRKQRAQQGEDQFLVGGEGSDQFTIPSIFKNVLTKQRLSVLGWHLRDDIKAKGFTFMRFLSAGGMGSVMLAVDNKTVKGGDIEGMDIDRLLRDDKVRKVAIKIIRKVGRDAGREYRLASRFQQGDRAVLVYSADELRGFPYMVMPYLGDVRDLHNLPETLKLLPRLVLCLRMAEALVIAHLKKLLHRDLKPANFLALMIRNASIQELWDFIRVFTTDFGLARDFSEADNGKILGTPRFMPPEQAWGKPLDEKADIYALGVTFYNVLTNRYPCPEDIWNDSEAILEWTRGLGSPAVQETDQYLNALGLPPAIIRIISQMTHPEPGMRPTAQEVVDVLYPYLYAMLPKEQERAQEVQKERGNKNLAILVGISAVVLIGLLVGIYFYKKRPDSHIEFGGTRKGLETDIREALSNRETSAQRIRDLLARYIRHENGRPSDYTVDEETDEPTDDEMSLLNSQARMRMLELDLAAQNTVVTSQNTTTTTRLTELRRLGNVRRLQIPTTPEGLYQVALQGYAGVAAEHIQDGVLIVDIPESDRFTYAVSNTENYAPTQCTRNFLPVYQTLKRMIGELETLKGSLPAPPENEGQVEEGGEGEEVEVDPNSWEGIRARVQRLETGIASLVSSLRETQCLIVWPRAWSAYRGGEAEASTTHLTFLNSHELDTDRKTVITRLSSSVLNSDQLTSRRSAIETSFSSYQIYGSSGEFLSEADFATQVRQREAIVTAVTALQFSDSSVRDEVVRMINHDAFSRNGLQRLETYITTSINADAFGDGETGYNALLAQFRLLGPLVASLTSMRIAYARLSQSVTPHHEPICLLLDNYSAESFSWSKSFPALMYSPVWNLVGCHDRLLNQFIAQPAQQDGFGDAALYEASISRNIVIFQGYRRASDPYVKYKCALRYLVSLYRLSLIRARMGKEPLSSDERANASSVLFMDGLCEALRGAPSRRERDNLISSYLDYCTDFIEDGGRERARQRSTYRSLVEFSASLDK